MAGHLIVGISGSTSSSSYNTKLLRAFGELVPADVEFRLLEGLENIPFYSPDLEGENLPEHARLLREAVREADGLVIASPEYNYSYTALAKNTIDWLSRPYGAHPLVGKAVAVIGASQGLLGTVRAQLHLRDVLHSTESDVLARPEVFVTQAAQKFDADGRLVDAATRRLLASLVDAFMEHSGHEAAEQVA
ncbi:MAG: NAD(P)H-dependent oxidoreductase [Actinomycetota bacterium]|nr:NAD(P)H-dependent oxidoreductase [Actinomycetota bacterium]